MCVRASVPKQGDFAVAWKETSSEIFVAHHHNDATLGLRYCFGTALQKQNRKAPTHLRHIIPGSDLYRTSFDICDKFNTGINKHKFPHKCGGRSHLGEKGQVHKFAMVVIMENVCAAYRAINRLRPDEKAFLDICNDVAIFLYMKSFEVAD